MFFNNKFKNDNFEDLERYEEYQRRKDEAMVKGVGNFFYKLIINSFIFLETYFILALFLIYIIGVKDSISYSIGFICAFFIFKIKYIKEKPFRSLILLGFIISLEIVAFGDIKI